jgi:hypothetical protein
MQPDDASAVFWRPLAPGWFLRWAAEIEQARHPRSAIRVVSPARGPLCGSVPTEWDGSTVVLLADDARCGLQAVL